MTQSTRNTLQALHRAKVAILGEAMLDCYLAGSSERISREAPVPIVDVREQFCFPGGAANTAVNVATLGGQAFFLSVIGDDEEGRQVTKSLKQHGVITTLMLADENRRTIAKKRVVSNSQQIVRIDTGSTEDLSRETEERLIEQLEFVYQECDALILSDYGYGIFTPRIIKALQQLQKLRPIVLTADSKDLRKFRNIGLTAVKPNYGEAIELLGLSPPSASSDRVEQIAQYGPQLLKQMGTKMAAITMDVEGSWLFENGHEPYRTYTTPSANAKAAGAGDTFIAALTLGLAAGATSTEAAELAATASSIVVQKEGTTPCYLQELREQENDRGKWVHSREEMARKIQELKEAGKKIVFTNGCFDILHRGHVTYLTQAKAEGDILVIGVNSDDSIKRLKGPERPINALEDRIHVLAGLSSVDFLIDFAEDTPVELVKLLQPDVYVKGGDYTEETLPEAPHVKAYGGAVRILQFLDNHSTTGLIKKIRQLVPSTNFTRPKTVAGAA